MNTQDRWHRVKEIFNDLLEKEPSQWDAELQRFSGEDQEVLDEVRALLDTVEEKTDLLEKPVTLTYDINEPLIGRVIKGFRVDAPITTGGQGQIFKATKVTDFDRTVVIKFIRGDRISDQAKDRFQQERQILADLNHPNIATMFDGGVTEEGWPYTIMPFINGMHIDKFIESKNLSKESILKLFIKVCDAVQAAHRRRIVHQDIKPENIMVDENGEPKLLDFGIAEVAFDRGKDEKVHPKPVTPQYASPEQLYFKPVSTSMDIYSLGVLLYKIFTSRVPFPFKGETGQDYQVYREKVWQEEIPKPSIFENNIDLEIESLILKCLDKEPNNRYQTVEDLKEDLERILENKPISCLSNNITYRTKCFAKRNPLVLVFLIISFFVVTLGSTWIWTERVKQHWAIIFSERARFIENEISKLHALPLQNTSEYLSKTESKIHTLKEQVEEANFFGRAPGNYALGRSYLALGDLESAKLHLDKAWNAGFKSPENSYILGKAYIQLYQQELRTLSTVSYEKKKEATKRLESEYLIPAKSFLKNAEKSNDESSDYLKALIEFYSEYTTEPPTTYDSSIFEKALTYAIKAYSSQPWLLEAHWLESFIYYQRAQIAMHHDLYDQAVINFQYAESALLKAKQKGPCAVSTYSQLGFLYVQMAKINESQSGLSSIELREKGIAAYEKALQVKPNDPINLMMLSEFIFHHSLIVKHDEAVSLLNKALNYVDKALENAPTLSRAIRTKGDILVEIALKENNSIQRKNELLERGIALIEEGTKDSPNFFDLFNLGYAYYSLGSTISVIDSKRIDFLKKAKTAFNKALDYNPNSKETLFWTGRVYHEIAKSYSDESPEKKVNLNESLKIFSMITENHPNYIYGYTGISKTVYSIAIHEYHTNPSVDSVLETISAGLSSFETASTIEPKNSEIVWTRGLFFTGLYNTHIYSETNIEQAFDRAMAEFNLSFELNPNAMGTNNIGWLYLHAFRNSLIAKNRNNEYIKRSKESFFKSLELNPTYSSAIWGLAEAYYLQGQDLLERKQSVQVSLSTSLEYLEKLDDLPIYSREILLLKPKIYLLYVENALLRNQNPDSFLQQASDSLKVAESFEAPFHEFYRAKLLRLQAVHNLQQKRSASAEFAQGIRLLDDLIERLPWRVEFYAERAMLKLIDAENAHPNARGLLQEAREDMDRVMANPNFAPWYREDSARIDRAIASLN